MQATLIAIAGPAMNMVATVQLEKEITVGRAAENDLALADVDVSRRHCTIACTGAGFLLRDLDSHNGTLVNGARIDQRLLEHGDRIGVGATTFLFVESDAAPPEMPARLEFADDPAHTQ